MTKEKLTLNNIRSDILKAVKAQERANNEAREVYIIPSVIIAVLIILFTKGVWFSLPFIALAAFNTVKYIPERRRSADIKKKISSALDRGDVSISIEKLSHISKETVYEPHAGRRRARHTKEVTFLYFLSGTSWRVPALGKHYEWSSLLCMSSSGIINTSVKDNEFYFISLKGYPNAAYVYNTKLFELDSGLKAC